MPTSLQSQPTATEPAGRYRHLQAALDSKYVEKINSVRNLTQATS